MRRLFILAMLVSVSLARQSQAKVPASFSVQGVLRNGSGALQSTSINVTANFYDAQSGGTLLAGPYSQNGVMAVNGLFTVTFNDSVLSGNLSRTTTDNVWLELSVGSETFPRQQVTAGIYSLMSAQADNATNAAHADTAASAASLSCSGCVTRANIQSNALAHSHAMSLFQTGAVGVNVPANSNTGIQCGNSCPGGWTVVGGLCRSNGNVQMILNESGIDANNNRYCCHWYSPGSAGTGAITTTCMAVNGQNLP